MSVDTKTIVDNTPGKILTGLGISAGLASIGILLAAGFFIYGRYLDSRLTKLRILQLKKELGITEETVVEKISNSIPVTVV